MKFIFSKYSMYMKLDLKYVNVPPVVSNIGTNSHAFSYADLNLIET